MGNLLLSSFNGNFAELFLSLDEGQGGFPGAEASVKDSVDILLGSCRTGA